MGGKQKSSKAKTPALELPQSSIINEKILQTALTWSEGMGLEFAGVDLAKPLAYEIVGLMIRSVKRSKDG